ncbi:MAG TPA: YihY family inner membrane protein [Rhodocyclaceae bacterium]|nr:YihY family inner membrane protein [Rhodocyclaceae bacterium]
MLLAPLRLIARVAKRFHAERCAQTVAALSFTTVLGLVPMIAGAIALISIMPFGSGLGAAVQKFLLANLLPDKAGVVIAKYVTQFALKAERLTWIGVVMLGVTALMQMLTIERTFNMIWRVKGARPFWRRVLMHTIALLFGPVVFGASLALITYVVTVSLGLVNEPGWFNAFLFRGLPFLFMVAMFALLYWAVPNRDVSRAHALFGGVFAAGCFVGMQKLFSIYLTLFPTYAVIYGAFSVLPIFLLWLYGLWTVILLGAYVVAELPNAAKQQRA